MGGRGELAGLILVSLKILFKISYYLRNNFDSSVLLRKDDYNVMQSVIGSRVGRLASGMASGHKHSLPNSTILGSID